MDAPLVAAATLRRAHGTDPRSCDAADVTHQLQLAHVLLDGGFDGVATLEEALAGGDHGLGTIDRLDGELIVVDGEPWRVNWEGRAELMPPQTLTPFVIVSTLDSPTTVRLQDVGLDEAIAAVESLVDDPGAVVSIRLEGAFSHVLVRSVKPQVPPYRGIEEVCRTDEVRWDHAPFFGVFVGFRFPDLEAGATIPGVHLHGLDRLRTTGGHCYDLHVKDAVLSVGVSRDVVMHLPDKSMMDLLEAPSTIRAVQRQLLRSGALTLAEIASGMGISPDDATQRIDWLSDRGFVNASTSAADTSATSNNEPRWSVTMHTHSRQASGKVADLLESL